MPLDFTAYHEQIKAQTVNPYADFSADFIAAVAEWDADDLALAAIDFVMNMLKRDPCMFAWFMALISRECAPVMLSHVAEAHPEMLAARHLEGFGL